MQIDLFGPLVDAAFGVDLDDARTASAVHDAEIRTELLQAEDALARDDARTAFTGIASAFDAAREKWRAERAHGRTPYRRPIRMEDMTADYVREALDRVEDLTEVQRFAPDLGEYLWFQSLRRGPGIETPVDSGEAKRAFRLRARLGLALGGLLVTRRGSRIALWAWSRASAAWAPTSTRRTTASSSAATARRCPAA
jgi:hypothetical protein